MKTIDELGISQWPWVADKSFISSPDENVCLTLGNEIEMDDKERANARLIKTSPKLYEALHDACSRRCLYCKLREADGSCNQPESDCVVQQWKKVLDEAAGEEVK